MHLFTCRADEGVDDEWKRMYQKWNYVPGEMVQVRCYTNLLEAELLCNGESLGKKSKDEEKGYISWILPYQEGALEAISVDTKIFDRLETTGSPCNVELNLWKDDNAEQWQDSMFDGSKELAQIEVTVTDSYNRRVVEDSTKLFVTVDGPAALLGIESGDLSDVTEYSASYRRTYEGKMIIYVQRKEEAGEITVTVNGDGLRKAVLAL